MRDNIKIIVLLVILLIACSRDTLDSPVIEEEIEEFPYDQDGFLPSCAFGVFKHQLYQEATQDTVAVWIYNNFVIQGNVTIPQRYIIIEGLGRFKYDY